MKKVVHRVLNHPAYGLDDKMLQDRVKAALAALGWSWGDLDNSLKAITVLHLTGLTQWVEDDGTLHVVPVPYVAGFAGISADPEDIEFVKVAYDLPQGVTYHPFSDLLLEVLKEKTGMTWTWNDVREALEDPGTSQETREFLEEMKRVARDRKEREYIPVVVEFPSGPRNAWIRKEFVKGSLRRQLGLPLYNDLNKKEVDMQ